MRIGERSHRRGRYLYSFIALFAIALLGPQAGISEAQERIYGFYPITDNNPTNADAVAPQLFVRVFDGEDMAKFEYTNIGPYNCSITEIYYDDGSLFGLETIIDKDNGGHPLVDFKSERVTPGNLPGGSAVGFYADIEFSVDAVSPAPQWGVEAISPYDQWLELDFDLLDMEPPATVENVFAELDSGVLRIGLHVSSIDGPGGTGSESFINNPYPVPEPAMMLLVGLGGMALIRKRRAVPA